MEKREKLINKLRELEHEYSYAEAAAESESKHGIKAKEKLAYLAKQYKRVESELSKLEG